MSTAEILEKLPKLTAEERQQLFDRLCELQELDLLNEPGPTEEEKKALNEFTERFAKNPDPGIPWKEALEQLRFPRKS